MARPSAQVERILVQRFVASSVSNVLTIVGQAIVDYANSRTSKQLIEMFEASSRGAAPSKVLEANEKLARAMQDAVIRSWGQAKRQLRPAVYDPKRTSRFSGGMERIIHADYLAVATPSGVQFGPIDLMDRDAAQWARLNFGALPRGQGSHEVFPVRFSNLPTFEFVFDEPARPAYGLPRGFWRGPDGAIQGGGIRASVGGDLQRGRFGGRSGAFYPLGGTQQFATQGNIGYHYLDAGIRRFFAELPRVYGELFDELVPGRRGRRPAPFEHRTISRGR